jgi:hypothetical protein
VNPRGIDHGRPGPRFFSEGFTSGLPELSFSFPKSYNSCAPDYNMIPLCVYPLVLYSTTVFHHCLLLLVHATISWCPASSVLESTIVRFPGKVASALLPQLIRRRLIYALLSRYAQPVLCKAPYVRSALRCRLAADWEAFARVDGLVERASIRGDTLAMVFPASQSCPVF